jgi:hypothetical protein
MLAPLEKGGERISPVMLSDDPSDGNSNEPEVRRVYIVASSGEAEGVALVPSEVGIEHLTEIELFIPRGGFSLLFSSGLTQAFRSMFWQNEWHNLVRHSSPHGFAAGLFQSHCNKDGGLSHLVETYRDSPGRSMWRPDKMSFSIVLSGLWCQGIFSFGLKVRSFSGTPST